MMRAAVFRPTGRLLTAEEAAAFVGISASAHLSGVELGRGKVVSAEPVEQFGMPGLWITMESTPEVTA